MAGMLGRANGARDAVRFAPAILPKASSAARAGEFRVTLTFGAGAGAGADVVVLLVKIEGAAIGADIGDAGTVVVTGSRV